MPDTTVVTLLFTDLVGSTEQSQRLGEDAAENLRRVHFAILREAISAHRGEEVKNLGDGVMAVFPSPSDAVACAIAMQQAADRHNRRAPHEIGLRVGVHIGEVTREADDYFGTAVVVAERLCKAAGGGQIVTSDVVRTLAGSRGGYAYRDLGRIELKGFSDPITSLEVCWTPSGSDARVLPHALATEYTNPFVGRDDERTRMHEAYKRSKVGQRQLVFLVGEPGIGKSRLSSEFAREVHADGATVLSGRCDEEALAPYQPFVEALRHFVHTLNDDELREAIGAEAQDVARLVPEVERRIAGASASQLSSDPESDRLRLFDAVVALLTAEAAERPLVVVLDDLHWADKPTLLLLRHLLRVEPFGVMLLATYRETDLDRAHPLASTLADLRRDHPFDRLHLKGLETDEVVEALERGAGHDIGRRGRALAGALVRATDGNPFFVEQIVGHLAETGRIFVRDGLWTFDERVEELGIPEGVKEVIGRRLSRLPEVANRVLGVGAVIGRDFDLDLLERVSDASPDEILDVLDHASASGVVAEVRGRTGAYTFTHALVRETLYEELAAARRVRLHRRVASALESEGDEHRLAELAHHLLEAAQVADVDRAIDYARRAAERATSLAAYEDASRLYERALVALELRESPDAETRCRLLIALGEARWRGGDVDASREVCGQAAELARELGDAELFALAALGVCGQPEFTNPADSRPDLLEHALRMLPERDAPVRALLLARLATSIALEWSERRAELARSAVEMARRLGDARTLAFTLRAAMFASWRVDSSGAELAAADEVVSLAESLGDRELLAFGHGWRLIAHLYAGDIDAMSDTLDAHRSITLELKQPLPDWVQKVWRSTAAVLGGRLQEGEELATEALDIGQRSGLAMAQLVFGGQMTVLRYLQGRLDELAALIRALVAQNPELVVYRTTLALIESECERPEATRAVFDELSADRFAAIPEDGFWVLSIVRLAEACAFLQDTEQARVLRDLLLPHENRNVLSGAALSVSGSVARSLGVLETVLGMYDEAERHLTKALAMHERMRTPPWIAITQRDLARLRAARGDRARAHDFAANALETARALGMSHLEQQASALL